jgi:CBS domain-containing protein
MTKTVADIMTPNPITVTANTSLSEAVKILAEKRFSGLPVVDDNIRLIGVIYKILAVTRNYSIKLSVKPWGK